MVAGMKGLTAPIRPETMAWRLRAISCAFNFVIDGVQHLARVHQWLGKALRLHGCRRQRWIVQIANALLQLSFDPLPHPIQRLGNIAVRRLVVERYRIRPTMALFRDHEPKERPRRDVVGW